LTTPLGITIGIGISTFYSPSSIVWLWVRGILDSMAGGILLYTGIVELMTYQYTINPLFHDLPKSKRAGVYISMYFGAIAMSTIGTWA